MVNEENNFYLLDLVSKNFKIKELLKENLLIEKM